MIQSIGPVTLSGTGADQLAFRSMSFSEGLSVPFAYTLTVLSDATELDPCAFLGDALTVTLEIDGQESRHFSGIVTEFSLLGSVGESTMYGVSLRPFLSLLRHTANCRIFQRQSVPDIVLAVLRSHGFSDVALWFGYDHEPREYVVQYRESDYNFICRLLEDEGIHFFFDHVPGKHVLVLCDSVAAHAARPGCETLAYYPPDPNRWATIAHIDHWQATHRVQPGACVLRDYDFQVAGADLGAEKLAPAPHGQGEFEVFDYPGGYDDVAAGTAIAQRRLEEVQCARARAEGRSNARGLCVGSLFTLDKHPIAAQNREYLVLGMEGTIHTHALESAYENVSSEGVFQCRFTCLDSSLPFQPPRLTPKPLIYGAQTAVVVGREGEEIWADEHGRVKLKFHWDRDPKKNEDSSCWVRVAQLWAGSGFGALHIPRIGQEVIVEFLEGDPDRPIVTGRVYNSDNMPPYELPSNYTQSGIKSRSTKGGQPSNFNEIRFEDKKGSEDLFIHAERTQTTKVKQSQSICVGASRSVTVGDTQTITVTKKETEKYLDAREMTVAKINEETITLEHKGTYKQGRTFKVSSRDDSLTVSGANKSTTVSGHYHIKADAEYKVDHEKNQVLLSGSKAEITNGKCKLTMDGGKLTLEAPESLTIKCGSTSITLTPQDCSAKGATVNLDGGNGGGRVALDAVGATMTGKAKASVGSNAATEISGSVVRIN